ncbi:MAG: methyltransferase domain-containing protein [Rhodanobacteraceae bacterium]|nr:methyltransferase domain-containing protein [Rhodanobacteraceae bacterium]
MEGNSPQIVSSQQGMHTRLAAIVQRHCAQAWRALLHAPTEAQFKRWSATRNAVRSLVVDLGCGHGDSTLQLAEHHVDAELLGIDQSADRLGRLAPQGYANHGRVTLMRAEAATLLRLLAAARIAIDVLYVLYPNPWPKPEHLMRRWHGHPVFPVLLANARRVVLRTNWRIYADEFVRAAQLLGRTGAVQTLADDAATLTPFERKYRASGHARFEAVIVDA